MNNLTELDICDLYFHSFHIPIGMFDEEGRLLKFFSATGQHRTGFYLQDAAYILSREKETARPVLRYDANGACWCRIPAADAVFLLGPVQTGHSVSFPYEGIPEHTWKGMLDIAVSLASLLLQYKVEMIQKKDTYTGEETAGKVAREILGDEELFLDPFDQIYECVREGNSEQLEAELQSDYFSDYLNRVIRDRSSARTTFYFCLARTCHTALESAIAIQDLTPLIRLYLGEVQAYHSLSAYKAGICRQLRDFTAYVQLFRVRTYSAPVSRACLYIRSHVYSPVSTRDIAAHCLTGLSTLQHRFKTETGTSLTGRIRAEKISRACYFLKHTGLSCGDIAFKMGYCSQSYFVTQFKKETGMTPAQYRVSSGSSR